MQHDGLSKDISNLHVTDEHDDGTNITTAAARLAEEAQQALHSRGRGVKDVTKQFTAASKLLPPGQLVKDEYFTLFDAVGALEIMDPKMDSGYVAPGDTFESSFDPCSDLDASSVLWIMDQLFCLETTWQEGYPLSQTIFTSLHVDRLLAPQNRQPYTFHYGKEPPASESTKSFLVHTVLRAYCIALVKSCELILFWIKAQTFFEEEDFVTHLFGRDLLPGASISSADDLLEEAERGLTNKALDEGIREALVARLQFRRHFLTSSDFNQLYWSDTLPQLLKRVDETHVLSVPIQDAFSEKVQRQLASSTPPRPMLTVSWDEAVKRWAQLCTDMVDAQKLIDIPTLQSPHCIQRATWAFVYRDPQPRTFARARMQDLLFAEQSVGRVISHYDLLLADMRDLVLAGDPLADPESFQIEVTVDPRHIRSRIMEDFLDKALDEYLNLYRMVCQNRCRMRRTFAQAIAIWDTLETEATSTDEKLNEVLAISNKDRKGKGPIASWAKFHKLRIMAWTIQLGFETDIYLPDELGGMYWFLSRLTAERSNLLDRIQHTLLERARKLTKPTDSMAAAECFDSQEWLQSLAVTSDASCAMASALWRLYTSLTSISAISTPKRDFAQAQHLHEARLKSFLRVVNETIPTAAEFAHANTQHDTLAATCQQIDSDLKKAKSLLADLKRMSPAQAKYVGTEAEWSKEIKQMETSCVAIAVAASQLQRIADKHGKAHVQMREDLSALVECDIPPPGSKRYHDWWVVPVVKERKQ